MICNGSVLVTWWVVLGDMPSTFVFVVLRDMVLRDTSCTSAILCCVTSRTFVYGVAWHLYVCVIVVLRDLSITFFHNHWFKLSIVWRIQIWLWDRSRSLVRCSVQGFSYVTGQGLFLRDRSRSFIMWRVSGPLCDRSTSFLMWQVQFFSYVTGRGILLCDGTKSFVMCPGFFLM